MCNTLSSYIAHVTRLDNDSLQKQLLFCGSGNPSNRWGKLSKLTGVDDIQLRRTMVDRKKFLQLQAHVI